MSNQGNNKLLFVLQRIGYLAASQSFHTETDVLMLATNLIRKDLGSQNAFDAGVALNGLSCFMTPDLARDLANDIFALVSLLTYLHCSTITSRQHKHYIVQLPVRHSRLNVSMYFFQIITSMIVVFLKIG